MEKHAVIRKLENLEKYKNRCGFAPNFIVTVRFQSKTNLFAHIDQLRVAFESWKNMHKILRAKVTNIGDGEDFYYVLNERPNIENVHFLRIESKSNLNEDHKNMISELLIEKCCHEWIDFDKPHQFLWRCLLLELDGYKTDNYNYELVWLVHHIIADGVSGKANTLLLLSLIEKTIKQEVTESSDFGFYPGNFSLFEAEINQNVQTKVPKVVIPEFVKAEDSVRNASTSITDRYSIDNIDFEVFDMNTENVYANFYELLCISRELNNTKPKRFIIESDLSKKLLQKYYL